MIVRVRWGFDRAAGARKRPVPLVRAYRGPYPDLSSRTMAEVMSDEEEERLGRPVLLRELDERPVVPPKVKKEAKPRIKSGATKEIEDLPSRRRGFTGAQTSKACRSQAGESERPGAGVGQDSAKGEQKARTPTKSKQAEVFPPKPASAPVAAAIAPPCRTTPPSARAPKIAQKIVIADKPSGMEAAAQKWRGVEARGGTLPPVLGEDGKIWCAGCAARVPTWFGRDCISAACSLKGSQ